MKKRIVFCLAVVILCVGLAIHASATSESMSSIRIHANVSSGGSCQITLDATLTLEQVQGKLRFPLPRSATGVTLNGSRIWTQKSGQLQYVDLSRLYGSTASAISFTLHYTLPDVIEKTDIGTLELQLPLLSGFAYPLSQVEFTITLPGAVSAKPAFKSGYHQSNIEKDLTVSSTDTTISGITNKELKDHETLQMFLPVPESLFPQPLITLFDSQADDIGMAVAAALALMYWLLFLRCLPPRRENHTTPPEGYSAGEISAVLTLNSADLSAMVLSWAQLGYLVILVSSRGRVRLQKSMEMGNERSLFEQQCFRLLFKKGDLVECSGYRYAQLVQKVAHMTPNIQMLVHRKSGNRRIFRGLSALIGLFAGISLGLAMSSGGLLQIPVAILFAIAGYAAAWYMQPWANSLFSHNRQALVIGCGIAALWLALCVLAGDLMVGLKLVGSQMLAGLMAFYGGRRTEAGRQALAQTVGLRRYLCHISKNALHQICRNNPEFYFTMAPYAISLGVGSTFARRFGNIPMPPCPYLSTGSDSNKTAAQWNHILENTLKSMNANSRRLPLQRIFSFFRRGRK